jgi:hypothetical protein
MAVPKKMALLIGCTNFENNIYPPITGDKDAVVWKSILINHHCYDENNIFELIGTDVTVRNIVITMLAMASKLQEKDHLTILYSTHGEYDKSEDKHYFTTYEKDKFITDSILFFLLRFFKPDICITLITDACQIGTLMQGIDTDGLNKKETEFIEKAVSSESAAIQTEVRKMLAVPALPLAVSIAHLAAVDNYTNAFDSVLTQSVEVFYNKVMLNEDTFSLGKISKLKFKLASIYRGGIWYMKLKTFLTKMKTFGTQNPSINDGLKRDLGVDFEHLIINKELFYEDFYSCIGKEKDIPAFIEKFKANIDTYCDFLNPDEKYEFLKTQFGNLENAYKYKSKDLPMLSFRGVFNSRFDTNYAFEA